MTLVAMILISSTFALVYYSQYQQGVSQNERYVGELNAALANYAALAGSYNASLRYYNATLSLLTAAVANLNTSTPAYRNASLALSSLWSHYQQLASLNGRKALVYVVHILVDFGNGTKAWHNGTSIQPGWNAYVVSLVGLGGNVQAAWYPQFGEHFVTGIDGVNQTETTSWFVWQFSGGRWTASLTGADQMSISNDTSIAWTLCPYDTSFSPTCSP